MIYCRVELFVVYASASKYHYTHRLIFDKVYKWLNNFYILFRKKVYKSYEFVCSLLLPAKYTYTIHLLQSYGSII